MVGCLKMFSIQSFLTWQSKLLMTYKNLSPAERYQIYTFMKAGHNQSPIAMAVIRHKFTIIRDFSLISGSRGYRPMQASENSAHRSKTTTTPRQCQLRLTHKQSCCFNCNGDRSRFRESCPSDTRRFT